MFCFNVIELEVKYVLFVMEDNMVFGVDGYNVCYFKYLWDIIKGELLEVV